MGESCHSAVEEMLLRLVIPSPPEMRSTMMEMDLSIEDCSAREAQ